MARVKKMLVKKISWGEEIQVNFEEELQGAERTNSSAHGN